ncbi:hypothetical protein CFC21_000719 [Triticum aestivum]|uniref:Uncharacterized protein n=1 Tax=Triticum aestivum TaxID=4565 RepID=A0A3B5XUQ4_WHEAT|nr:hypothetical protein CFC21_000719 [Triticum aestivum]
MTLFRVLDGNRRVKFMTRGKHLWARQKEGSTSLPASKPGRDFSALPGELEVGP